MQGLLIQGRLTEDTGSFGRGKTPETQLTATEQPPPPPPLEFWVSIKETRLIPTSVEGKERPWFPHPAHPSPGHHQPPCPGALFGRTVAVTQATTYLLEQDTLRWSHHTDNQRTNQNSLSAFGGSVFICLFLLGVHEQNNLKVQRSPSDE